MVKGVNLYGISSHTRPPGETVSYVSLYLFRVLESISMSVGKHWDLHVALNSTVPRSVLVYSLDYK